MTTFAFKIKRGLDMWECRQRQGRKARKLWAEDRPILASEVTYLKPQKWVQAKVN